MSTPARPPDEPQANFDLIRDEEFNRLVSSIPGFKRGRLIAIVEGRFDSVRWGPFGWWQRGYGHHGIFRRRLVLHRVVAVRVDPPVPEEQ